MRVIALALLLVACGNPRGYDYTVIADGRPELRAEIDATYESLDAALAATGILNDGDTIAILMAEGVSIYWLPADSAMPAHTWNGAINSVRVIWNACPAKTALAHELAHLVLCRLLHGVHARASDGSAYPWWTCDHEHTRELWWAAVNASELDQLANHPGCNTRE